MDYNFERKKFHSFKIKQIKIMDGQRFVLSLFHFSEIVGEEEML